MPKKSPKKTRVNGGRPDGKAIGSPLGHRGVSGAYGKPMQTKAPKSRSSSRSR